jgi:hypothetical protein
MRSLLGVLAGGVGLGLAVSMAVSAGVGAQGGVVVGRAAPEIGGGPWINGEPPALRGRVVFVEFWTYG